MIYRQFVDACQQDGLCDLMIVDLLGSRVSQFKLGGNLQSLIFVDHQPFVVVLHGVADSHAPQMADLLDVVQGHSLSLHDRLFDFL